jgi:uncharacterized protein (TIGR03435 family)
MDFLVIAYHIHSYQISSKLPLDKDRFDLEARVPEGATKEQFREMMQGLLAERFRMKVHMETRDFPAYELSVGKTGLTLSAAGGEEYPTVPANRPGFSTNFSNSGRYMLLRMRVRQEPLSILAENLEMPAGKPVVDKTGLDSLYDFTLAFTVDQPGADSSGTTDPAPAPDLFKAIQQMGLQLTPKKLPFKVVVVDAVNKVPVEN